MYLEWQCCELHAARLGETSVIVYYTYKQITVNPHTYMYLGTGRKDGSFVQKKSLSKP